MVGLEDVPNFPDTSRPCCFEPSASLQPLDPFVQVCPRRGRQQNASSPAMD